MWHEMWLNPNNFMMTGELKEWCRDEQIFKLSVLTDLVKLTSVILVVGSEVYE